MAVNFYKWDDPGAPQLRSVAGDLIAVLDACLVNGYGSKVGAGWTKEYYDAGTQQAVYRAPSGNRCYLWVKDTGTFDAQVAAFATMSGVNFSDGTEPFADTATNYYWPKRLSTDTSIGAKWEMFVSDKTMYLVSRALNDADRVVHVFGDYISLDPNFNYNSVISLPRAHATTGAYDAMLSIGPGYVHLRRSWDNIESTSTEASYMLTFQASPSFTYLGKCTDLTLPNDLSGNLMFDRIGINADNALMGYLPGIYNMYRGSSMPFDFSVTVSGTGVFAGRELRIVNLFSSSCVAFDITGPWE